jgi:ankyrin repeat protein
MMKNTRTLREHPDLDQLKRQAKELLHDFQAGKPAAIAEVRSHYHGADPSTFALHHAQLVLARCYGFDSWPKLKAYVDGATVQRIAEFVRANDLPQVRAMLNARPELADMQLSYGDEHRPLHFAVMQRLPEMVRLLMEHGAGARHGIHPHRDATSPLTIAIERGYDDIVAIIHGEEQKLVPEPDAPPPPPLPGMDARGAVERGDLDWLRSRHAEGTLTNPISWRAGGLLTAAVQHNRPDILTLLLDFGFDPDERIRDAAVDGDHFSKGYPLYHCAALGRAEMAEILLRRGADPNVHVDSSGSSVHSAFSHKQWAMVDLLRRYGGIVGPDTAALYRRTDLVREMLTGESVVPPGIVPEGKTLAEYVLDFACSGGDPDSVRLALERIDWPPDDGRWPRYLIRAMDFWNHIPWLRSANQELNRGTYIQCFRQVLARCGPNVVGSFGRTALHEVGAMGDHITEAEAVEFARALLDAGARTDIRDTILKSTALGWACRWGRVAAAQLLIDRGADPVEADGEPWARPRAWAEKMGHESLLRLFA